jgi:Zn-dependent protease
MQKGSISLFRIAGIQLSVHVTFFILLAYVGWEGWKELGVTGMVLNIAHLLAFFVCVVLHELGHSFMARRFGVKVSRILLMPIGGMAEFTRMPRLPRHEILIAAAGPAVNFLIVCVLLVFTSFPSRAELSTMDISTLQLLLLMNVMMGCFNLLPAFPMDGGRILRALLARRYEYVDATRYAATLGKVIAIAGAAVMAGVFGNFLGALLFIFIMAAGELEYRSVRRQEEERRWVEISAQNFAVPPPLPPELPNSPSSNS